MGGISDAAESAELVERTVATVRVPEGVREGSRQDLAVPRQVARVLDRDSASQVRAGLRCCDLRCVLSSLARVCPLSDVAGCPDSGSM